MPSGKGPIQDVSSRGGGASGGIQSRVSWVLDLSRHQVRGLMQQNEEYVEHRDLTESRSNLIRENVPSRCSCVVPKVKMRNTRCGIDRKSGAL